VNYILKLDAQLKDELWRHLLPTDLHHEQAAFLYTVHARIADGVVFNVVAHELLAGSDFAAQYSDYLELADKARVRIIKRAHALNASIVEIHSHPWDRSAEFSASDRAGLKETVPHMRWRLKERPYLAVVVARVSYDALVWALNGEQPELLALEVDGARLLPTGRSIRSWNGCN
jgi:hypothetical protein